MKPIKKNFIAIKTESKYMKVSLLMFDRLLHSNKIFFNLVSEKWQFKTLNTELNY